MLSNGDYSLNDIAEKEEIQKIVEWVCEVFDCYEWGGENTKRYWVMLAIEEISFEQLFYCLIFFVACMMVEDENAISAMIKDSLVDYVVRSHEFKENVARILGNMNLNRLGTVAKFEHIRIGDLIKDQVSILPMDQKDATLFVAAYILFLPQVAKEQADTIFIKAAKIFQSRAWDIFIAAVQRRLAQQI